MQSKITAHTKQNSHGSDCRLEHNLLLNRKLLTDHQCGNVYHQYSKSDYSTYNIISYMVKTSNTTYPVIQDKIIKDNESCWKNTAQVRTQIRTLKNNMTRAQMNSL